MDQPEKFIVSSGEVYKMVRKGEFLVPEKTGIAVMHAPTLGWYGNPIPFELWHQVISFFQWTLEEYNSEAIVRLFYSESLGEWRVLVFPQTMSGMSVNEKDNEQAAVVRSSLGEGWKFVGTIHHHCRTSAFQSSTDHEDERTKRGLHITVGSLDAAKYTIHARGSFSQEFHEINLSSWFEIVPGLSEWMEPAEYESFVRRSLEQPFKNTEFPDEWKAMCTKPALITMKSFGDLSNRWSSHHLQEDFDQKFFGEPAQGGFPEPYGEPVVVPGQELTPAELIKKTGEAYAVFIDLMTQLFSEDTDQYDTLVADFLNTLTSKEIAERLITDLNMDGTRILEDTVEAMCEHLEPAIVRVNLEDIIKQLDQIEREMKFDEDPGEDASGSEHRKLLEAPSTVNEEAVRSLS